MSQSNQAIRRKFNRFEFGSLCPGCLVSFVEGKIQVIFKDVVECTGCGAIFIADEYDLKKYIVDLRPNRYSELV